MSDFIPDYRGFTPEDAAAAQAGALDANKKLYNSLFSIPLTSVDRDPALPGLARFIPFTGIAEGLTGTAGAALNAGATLGNAALDATGLSKYGLHIPSAPEWMTKAGEHFEDTRHGIQQDIAARTPLTAPDLTNESDRLLDVVGSTIGGALPIVPGGFASAVANAMPRGLKTLTGALLPSTAHFGSNVPIAVGLTAENVAHEAADAPAASPTAPVVAGQPDQPTEDGGFAGALQPIQEARNQTPNTASDVGFSGYIAQQATSAGADGGFSGALSGANPLPIPGPDTGYSGMTVGQALWTIGGVLTALAAGKFVHGAGNVINDTERTARFNNPDYAARASDYNNERILRGGGAEISPTSGQAMTPPLAEQNRFRQATNTANDKLLNSNAQMQDAIQMSADPTVAQQLAHQYGMTHNDMAFRTKMENFLETGRDPISGVAMPKPAKLYADIGALDEDRARTLNDGLHAQDELDNRIDNARVFGRSNPGVTPSADDIRHNFKGQDNAELNTIIQRMQSDPALADMAARFHGITNGLTDIGQGRGFFTSSEVADLKATHPNYVPEVGPTGETSHPMQRRDKTIATGTDQVNSKAIYNLAQHIEELYRQFELNDMNRNLRQSQMDTQRQFPNSAQFMYDVQAPKQSSPTFYTGGGLREPIVTIRHATGPTFTRVDHPDYYNAMSGNSLKKRDVGAGLLTMPRRMYQYLTTGVGSLVTGRIAPLVNVGYTGLTMGTNAPRGMYGGLLDRAVQRNLPGRAASMLSPIARGIDTVSTTPIGIGYSYLRGVGDRWIPSAAKIIAPGQNNIINNTLRAYYGDAYVNTWQQTMRDVYQNSRTNAFRDLGIGGQGIPVKTDLPALQITANKQANLVAAHMVPKLFNPGMYGVKPFVLNVNRAVEEAMSHISDAGHEYFARLNWDNPNVSKDTLAYETRNLTGDPGTHGSSAVLQKITSVLPYANISMQGGARLGRSIGERPIGAPMTLATGLGTLALLEIFTHMRSQAHLDYLQNGLSAQQQAGNIVLATNDDPTKPTMIPVPQEMRTAKAFMSAIMGKAMNIIAMQHDPDWYKNVWNGITDFLGSHVSNTSVDAMIQGGVDAADFVNLPAYAGHIDWNGVIHGKSVVDAYRPPTAGQPVNLPNQIQDGPLDDKQGKIFSGILRSVLGLAGVAIDGANNVARYAKQTGSWVDALGMGGHDWLQGMQDRNPQLNTLWEHQLRSSMQPPIEQKVQRKMDALSQLPGSRSDPRFEGFSGKNRFALPVPMSTTEKPPTDPTMQTLFAIAGAYKTRMAPREQEITEMRKQMAADNAQGGDVAARRALSNQRTRAIADKYRLMDGMLSDMEYALSTQVGKPVHIDDIDWTKGPEQFH